MPPVQIGHRRIDVHQPVDPPGLADEGVAGKGPGKQIYERPEFIGFDEWEPGCPQSDNQALGVSLSLYWRVVSAIKEAGEMVLGR